MLGVRAGTIARWERFEAETIRTRHANGRLLALFATFAKWYAPLSMGAELRSALGSDDSGLSALQVLFDRFQAPRKTD